MTYEPMKIAVEPLLKLHRKGSLRCSKWVLDL